MGFHGDAMKASNNELEQLLSLQQKIIAQRKLVADAQELSRGGKLEQQRERLAEISTQLSEARLENEELRRELKRQEGDLQTVEKRIAMDTERLKTSFSTKDIAGIQHELDTLARRKSDLEDVELELMERLQESDAQLHSLEREREQQESEIELTKQAVSIELADLKQENQQLATEASAIRAQLAGELLDLFDAKLVRGLAVGRLVGSACTACNMSLNSLAMGEVSSVPQDQLASCPECGAMLVRS